MSYLDYQFEILRGQIEEVQGRLEEILALRRGRGGMLGSLKGRSRRMRGKARQTYARARHGVLGFRPKVSMPSISVPGAPMAQETSSFPTKYVYLAVGLVLILVAVLWPGLLSDLWRQASGTASRSAAEHDPLTTSEL